jgi:hypothetical protein
MAMFQPVMARYDSSVVTLSSDDAKTDAVYGNGKFTCAMANTNRGCTHAVKIVPTLVLVPNVFSNVYVGMNAFATTDSAPTTYAWSIVPGFYSLSMFVDAFNVSAAKPAYLTLAVSNTGYTRFVNSGVGARNAPIQMSVSMSDMLGFTDRALFPIVLGVVVVTVLSAVTVTANAIPRMGTTPVVYVVARQLAVNRMIASDSRDYNVLATVSLHDVPYGSYGVYRGVNMFMDDIEFRTPQSLNQLDVELLDINYMPLTVDVRFPVIIQLKVFHTDTLT